MSKLRNAYNFGLIFMVLFGASLIIIGAELFNDGGAINETLIGIGVSMAPAAIIAAVFRFFLFDEIKSELTEPIFSQIKNSLEPEIKNQISSLLNDYKIEISLLKELKGAGIVKPFRNRELAVKYLIDEIKKEENEIQIVGSSLKGLLQDDAYNEIRDEIQSKVEEKVKVLFLLTHPKVADLRAKQEARRREDIGSEITDSLIILKSWGVPAKNVRLYVGTPTCFGIKTSTVMLLNPYPYGEVAYDSPCLVVEKRDDDGGYFFSAFNKSHFGVWDTDIVAQTGDLEKLIQELKSKIKDYSNKVQELMMA